VENVHGVWQQRQKVSADPTNYAMARAHHWDEAKVYFLLPSARYADDVLLLYRRGKAEGNVSTVYSGKGWLTCESMFIRGVEEGIL
jgi:hypothetical protein